MKVSLITIAFLSSSACGFQTPVKLSHHVSFPLKDRFINHKIVTSPIPKFVETNAERFSSNLGMSEADKEGKKPRKVVTPEKIAGRKKRVKVGYQIITASQCLIGLAFWLGRFGKPFYGVGPFLQAGIAYILKGAAENDRLRSDTYKRLNLAVFQFGLISLLASIKMKSNPILTISSIIAMINSIKGYGYGLKGWELAPTSAKEDLLKGISSNLSCMTKIPNIKSAGYWAATVAMVSMTVAKTYEVLNILISSSGDSFLLGTRLFRLAKYKLFSVIMFTLKDAADRGRLEGTTFVELNLMAAVSYALWAGKIDTYT